MTFVVSDLGRVLEKDLRPDTAALGSAMAVCNPDASWAEIEDCPT